MCLSSVYKISILKEHYVVLKNEFESDLLYLDTHPDLKGLCLYVADPATFLASKKVLPVRTAWFFHF